MHQPQVIPAHLLPLPLQPQRVGEFRQFTRELVKLGGDPVYRQGVITDNGNVILDVHNMEILDPPKLETQINALVGVVTNGLFAHRGANTLIIGTEEGAIVISPS